jgi:hypothetical protein
MGPAVHRKVTERPDAYARGDRKRTDVRKSPGGVISAILANLFMHYAFDHWMTSTWPQKRWIWYADDGLIHCYTLQEGEHILEQLQHRMNECHLEINPEKTRIVYCKDDNLTGDYEKTSFVFLGHGFRARAVRTRKGKCFHRIHTSCEQRSHQKPAGKDQQIQKAHKPFHNRTGPDIEPHHPGMGQLFLSLHAQRRLLGTIASES